MDERDLNVAVTPGAPLDKRQGGEESLAATRCSVAAALGGCGVLCMGRCLHSGEGPVVEFAARGRSTLWHVYGHAPLATGRNPSNSRGL